MNREPPNPYTREFATGPIERQERYRRRQEHREAAELAIANLEQLDQEINQLREDNIRLDPTQGWPKSYHS